MGTISGLCGIRVLTKAVFGLVSILDCPCAAMVRPILEITQLIVFNLIALKLSPCFHLFREALKLLNTDH